jgi:hypothetical protein
MMKRTVAWTVLLIICFLGAIVKGGPYREKGICSYIGPDHKATTPCDPNGDINPIFRGWADSAPEELYVPTLQYMQPWWHDPTKATGQSMSDTDGVYTVSLGDLYQDEIDAGVSPGQITLSFTETIRDQNGYDFVVFENGFYYMGDEYYCEFGYVEVSSNGTDFVRFPSVDLTDPLDPNQYNCFLDITQVYNLAGKHPNNYGQFTGTPFDLSEITNEPNVVAGLVDLNNISYVRIVDIPGSGNYFDNARKLIDPCTWPNWDYYDVNHPIYDAWLTYGSGGFDLEGIGVLQPQEYGGDINLDGIVDFEDLDIFAQCWLSHFGQDNYLSRCDLAKPKDLTVNFRDFAEFAKGWRKVEQWR